MSDAVRSKVKIQQAAWARVDHREVADGLLIVAEEPCINTGNAVRVNIL